MRRIATADGASLLIVTQQAVYQEPPDKSRSLLRPGELARVAGEGKPAHAPTPGGEAQHVSFCIFAPRGSEPMKENKAATPGRSKAGAPVRRRTKQSDSQSAQTSAKTVAEAAASTSATVGVTESAEADLILISHEISRELYLDLCSQLDGRPKAKACTIFLTTYGGDPHAGFRIARCLRHHYERVRLVVPYFCKSAGTLIAIGADELAIGDRGELGPLDIQIANPSEIFERSSGLDLTAAMEFAMGHVQTIFRSSIIDIRRNTRLSTKLAGDLATKLAIGMVEPIYQQIDPVRLGETQRAMKVTNEYGKRLNEHTKVLKAGALNKLVGGYPAHGFVIDRKEAKNLFTSVEAPTELEVKICTDAWDIAFRAEGSTCVVIFGENRAKALKELEHGNENASSVGKAGPGPRGGSAAIHAAIILSGHSAAGLPAVPVPEGG